MIRKAKIMFKFSDNEDLLNKYHTTSNKQGGNPCSVNLHLPHLFKCWGLNEMFQHIYKEIMAKTSSSLFDL